MEFLDGLPLAAIKHHSSMEQFNSNILGNEIIYRILDFQILTKILSENIVQFLNPQKYWHDPFENYILNSKHFIKMHGNFEEIPLKNFSNALYGQCWTLTPESDAMWRLYSQDGKGVRIKTSIEKIKEALDKSRLFGQSKSDFVHAIGKVNYFSEQEIIDYVMKNNENKIFQEELFNMIMKPFFIKRTSYSHESEIRVAFLDKRINIADESTIHPTELKFDINPIEYIDEITFDPRISQEDFKRCHRELRILGYEGEINKSNLYEFPRFSFFYSEFNNHFELDRVELGNLDL